MKKIGQITWIAYLNFGSSLQAFALQYTLKKLGYDGEVIDDLNVIRSQCTKVEYYYMRLKQLIRHPQQFVRYKKKEGMYRNFAKRHIPINSGWRSYEELDDRYDAYVCGSDQIWSPLRVENPNINLAYYFAAFGRKPKVAYAPSLGTRTGSERYAETVRPWLAEFRAISVREADGARILENVTGLHDIPVVADPTLLLTREEYLPICAQRMETRPYMLAYLLTYNVEYLQYITKLATDAGLKLLILGDDLRLRKWGDRNITAGPSEFLSLIANAEAVATDSFHGSIFTLQFARPLLCLKRFSDTSRSNQNSRIENLFAMLGIPANRFFGEQDLHRVDAVPMQHVTDPVRARWQTYSNQSVQYLKSALHYALES
jgi:hypothetical protein